MAEWWTRPDCTPSGCPSCGGANPLSSTAPKMTRAISWRILPATSPAAARSGRTRTVRKALKVGDEQVTLCYSSAVRLNIFLTRTQLCPHRTSPERSRRACAVTRPWPWPSFWAEHAAARAPARHRSRRRPHNHGRVDDHDDNACNYNDDRVDIDDNDQYRPARRLHLRSEHAVRRAKRRSGVVHVRRIRQLAAEHHTRSAGDLRIPPITRSSPSTARMPGRSLAAVSRQVS